MNDINLVMPMAGAGSRFNESGFDLPKPLIEINGKPFFYWATESIRNFNSLKSLTFVVLKDHIINYDISKSILNYYPEANIVVLDKVLEGAVLTCLEGVKAINNDKPVIFNDCDHMFKSTELNQYIKENNSKYADGGLLYFESSKPIYSYIVYNEEGYAIGTVEKKVVSNHAICGAYFFGSKQIFIDSSMEYLKNCKYSEFFMSGVYNIMGTKKLDIRDFKVDFHVPFGIPEEYEIARKSTDFDKVISR